MYKFSLLFIVGVASAQFTCPGIDGFYPDPYQCDKYYECYWGHMIEKLCPDGLVFEYTLSPRVEKCNYPFTVECPEGSFLQSPQPSGSECPRQNGYFKHVDPSNCEQYYKCTGGLAFTLSCTPGYVFDESSGTCQWGYTSIRQGCSSYIEVLPDGFSCPSTTLSHEQNVIQLRFRKLDDCRFFYICVEGIPREVMCPEGTVFNGNWLVCDNPQNVPGCENYYSHDLAAASLKK